MEGDMVLAAELVGAVEKVGGGGVVAHAHQQAAALDEDVLAALQGVVRSKQAVDVRAHVLEHRVGGRSGRLLDERALELEEDVGVVRLATDTAMAALPAAQQPTPAASF